SAPAIRVLYRHVPVFVAPWTAAAGKRADRAGCQKTDVYHPSIVRDAAVLRDLRHFLQYALGRAGKAGSSAGARPQDFRGPRRPAVRRDLSVHAGTDVQCHYARKGAGKPCATAGDAAWALDDRFREALKSAGPDARLGASVAPDRGVRV